MAPRTHRNAQVERTAIGLTVLKALLEQETGLSWTPEHRFDAKRKFRFDLAQTTVKIALEKEGGIWTGGSHTRGVRYSSDCEKYNLAAVQGWIVLRYPSAKLGDAVADVLAVLKRLGWEKNGKEKRNEKGNSDFCSTGFAAGVGDC